MALKNLIKKLIKKTTGLSVYKDIPFGVDPFYDIKQRLKDHNFKTFLDVGANIGQSAIHIREEFPEANIHSIEPIKKTFKLLRQNTKGLQVTTHNYALGATNETVVIKIDEGNANSTINSLINDNNEISTGKILLEEVQVLTVVEFCRLHKIDHIDYLKIDTEGYDLEVIKGAAEMLANHAIGFVEVEVSMNPGNRFHIAFEEVKNYLEQKNYFLFGLYEQVPEWKLKTHVLRRSNAVFISEELIKQ